MRGDTCLFYSTSLRPSLSSSDGEIYLRHLRATGGRTFLLTIVVKLEASS